jgi:ribosomal-protein-alanine N-acetyltransferase
MAELRLLDARDLPAMEAVEALCFPEDPWPAGQLAGALEGEGAVALGCWEDGILLAMALGRFILDEGELHSIATLPERRGEGIGALLLDTFLTHAAQKGVERIWLEVRQGNGAAQRMYQGRGFKVEGRRRRYYDDGEDALVMGLSLSGPRRSAPGSPDG